MLLTCSHVRDYHIIEYLSHQPVVSMETHCSHLLHCDVLVWKGENERSPHVLPLLSPLLLFFSLLTIPNPLAFLPSPLPPPSNPPLLLHPSLPPTYPPSPSSSSCCIICILASAGVWRGGAITDGGGGPYSLC